jgi:hypothetical protein
MYRWTSLYAKDRDQKIRLAYKEFANKKTTDDYKIGERYLKKANFNTHIRKIADKKTAYNEVRLYSQT